MALLFRLIPARFSEASQSRIIRVFNKVAKSSTIPEIETKQYALAKFRGIINALGAL